ncbi:hypothetical protein [Streptomyces sp. NEAU-174]|uniref:hypothetical protein n=1 Tax=Streptomyces sp. NEAU-174 TaxID=3458254 RepID=UPI004045055B
METVETERADRSIGETAPVFEALDPLPTSDPEQMWRDVDARKDATPRAPGNGGGCAKSATAAPC